MEVSGQLQAPAALTPEKRPLYRTLDGPKSQSRYYGEEKNTLPLTGNWTDSSVIQHIAQSNTDWAILASIMMKMMIILMIIWW
jgi:hypothetical protein